MTRTPDMQDGLRELDCRVSDGIEVRLLWQPGADDVIVEVTDTKCGDLFRFEVAGSKAVDVFQHPFAHAAFDGVEFAEPDVQPLHT